MLEFISNKARERSFPHKVICASLSMGHSTFPLYQLISPPVLSQHAQIVVESGNALAVRPLKLLTIICCHNVKLPHLFFPLSPLSYKKHKGERRKLGPQLDAWASSIFLRK